MALLYFMPNFLSNNFQLVFFFILICPVIELFYYFLLHISTIFSFMSSHSLQGFRLDLCHISKAEDLQVTHTCFSGVKNPSAFSFKQLKFYF